LDVFKVNDSTNVVVDEKGGMEEAILRYVDREHVVDNDGVAKEVPADLCDRLHQNLNRSNVDDTFRSSRYS
jgi:hypothetical protein